jgi:hypothetical protein
MLKRSGQNGNQCWRGGVFYSVRLRDTFPRIWQGNRVGTYPIRFVVALEAVGGPGGSLVACDAAGLSPMNQPCNKVMTVVLKARGESAWYTAVCAVFGDGGNET